MEIPNKCKTCFSFIIDTCEDSGKRLSDKCEYIEVTVEKAKILSHNKSQFINKQALSDIHGYKIR